MLVRYLCVWGIDVDQVVVCLGYRCWSGICVFGVLMLIMYLCVWGIDVDHVFVCLRYRC
jgi:hypothetical protein